MRGLKSSTVLGEEVIDSLPDRLDPRNAVKGG